MGTSAARKDPSHPRWQKIQWAEMERYTDPKGTEYLRITLIRRNHDTVVLTYRRKPNEKLPNPKRLEPWQMLAREYRKENGAPRRTIKWVRETIHRANVVRKDVKSYMPRIGGGTGQTERKPVKIVTEHVTPELKEHVQKWEFSTEELVEFIRGFVPSFDPAA